MSFRFRRTSALTTVVDGDPLSVVDERLAVFHLAVIVTGTIDVTVQFTLDGTNWFDNADLTNVTASATAEVTVPVAAFRLKVNSVAGGSAYLSLLGA